MRRNNLTSLVGTGSVLGLLLLSAPQLHAESVEENVSTQENAGQERSEAFHQLQKTETLESAYVGFAAMPSENLQNLREILADGNAESLLRQLYQTGTLTAKMYAILGFQLLEKPDEVQALIADARQFAAETIQVMEGCIIWESSVGDVLKKIEAGHYWEEFKQAQPS